MELPRWIIDWLVIDWNWEGYKDRQIDDWLIGTGGGNKYRQVDDKLDCFGFWARKLIYCDSPRENLTSAVNPFPTQVNLARRQGVAVSTETKYGAGGNTQVWYRPSYRD